LGQIKKVLPLKDYCLEVQLGSGSIIILNMKGRLNTVRFGMLSDEVFFNTVTTDGICLRWGNKIEISLSEVFQLAQK
jgi:hypothetical protein